MSSGLSIGPSDDNIYYQDTSSQIAPSIKHASADGQISAEGQVAVGKTASFGAVSDTIEEAEKTDASAKSQNLDTPALFGNASDVVGVNSDVAVQSGLAASAPSPSRFNDMIKAANQLIQEAPQEESGAGSMTMLQYLKAIGDAIAALEKTLAQQQQSTTQRNLDIAKNPLEQIDTDPLLDALKNSGATNSTTSAAATAQANLVSPTKLTSLSQVSSQVNSLQDFVNNLVKGGNVDPSLGQLMTVLGELEYVQAHQTTNVSGGIILGNYPQIAYELHQLGIDLPSNPDNMFSGMAEKLASKGTPPYDEAKYADMAKQLPAGWEVISGSDMQNLIAQVASKIKTAAGDNYGVLATPLANLFGYTLFAYEPPPPDPNLNNYASLKGMFQDLLNQVNKYGANAPNMISSFIFGHYDQMRQAVNLGIIPSSYLSDSNNGIWSGFNSNLPNDFSASHLQNIINVLNNKIDTAEAAIHQVPPPGVTGPGMIASGALSGSATSQMSDALNQLFATELGDSFNNTTLTPAQRDNVQQLASLSLMASVLGTVVNQNQTGSNSGQALVQGLDNTVKSLVNSGAANNLVKAILGGGSSGTGFSEFELGILQSVTQGFMINLGVSTSAAGSSKTQANSILNELKKDDAISSQVSSAQAFLNADPSSFDNRQQFQSVIKQVAPQSVADLAQSQQTQQGADLSQGQIDNEETLRQMIKMLKQIQDAILSGGAISQKIGQSASQLSQDFGASTVQNTIIPNSSV